MSDVKVGQLVLGGNVFGWTANRDESFRILDAFVDAGGTAIDTADVYSAWIEGNSGGESETIIGEWLEARPGVRDRVVIATKVCQLRGREGLSPENLNAAIDDSLTRLRTDRVDIYYAHRDDENVEQADYLAGFDALVKAGKVRATGISNFSADRIRSAAAIATSEGLTLPSFSQDDYSLVERGIEADVVPALRELGIHEVPYFSLAAGFLTGKYRPGVEAESARKAKASAYLEDDRNLHLLTVLDEVAAERKASVTAVSLAWLRAQPAVAAPIASARTVDQLGSLIESFDLLLSSNELQALTHASAR